ncbi:Uncaracterized surface protein containing fasciclin (FAS1) repeats [Belliella buryatensis]|uniref:Uncaracterized surface protein containing fasciclin (FAS1) repeats n=1 Tax=Belliella buryatensis TaxID=1500549 RepID=A0A239CSE6_9BACT|nr:fasciclin domain-containing protein [Belliella buryatensis]SNS22688.1 Uncaracterized surface protein containing fasciclin (FAS1) repeats [Belliella buryatensis]
MKLKTNQLIWSAVLTIFALGFTACADLEEVSPTLDAEVALYDIPTTIDRMQHGIPSNAGAANERRNAGATFSTFNAALGSTGLASVFSRNDLTAFAPTDAAFAELGLNPGNVRDLPGLRDILLYHVVAGTVLSTDLTNTFVPTVNGQFIGISADNLTINGANIVAADIRARNGVIHAIDAVLLPPSQNIVEVALGNENFSILVEAVVAAGFVDLLATTNNLTVFAPTNDAFVDLLGELGFGSLEELIDEEDGIGLAGLQGVLAYHVFDGRVFSTDLSNGTITMFSGDEVTVDVSGPSLIDQNDRTSGIVATDIQATNGVIHVIDKVILP